MSDSAEQNIIRAGLLRLEDYREQPLVGASGLVSRLFNGDMLPFLFHDITHVAFYMTIDALREMQKTRTIGPTQYGIPAIAMWFVAVESYISTLYKLVCEVGKASGIKQTQKIMEKVSEIDRYISNGIIASSALRNRLQEFVTFRNTLLHDLTYVKQPTYVHTAFAKNAEKMNQVDLFQGIMIAIDTFGYYRHVIADMDLMPNVYINAQFEQVDKLSEEILFPAFAEILEKRGVRTDLRVSLSNETLGYDINIGARMFISYDGPVYPKDCEERPFIIHRYFQVAEQARPIDPGVFKVPNYTRK